MYYPHNYLDGKSENPLKTLGRKTKVHVSRLYKKDLTWSLNRLLIDYDDGVVFTSEKIFQGISSFSFSETLNELYFWDEYILELQIYLSEEGTRYSCSF